MTLAALWSRQGKLMLSLAFLAATVALVGASLWVSTNRAEANVVGGTVTVTQDQVGTVDIGDTGACGVTNDDCVVYTATIATTATPTGTFTNGTFEIQADPNLWPISFGPHTGAWAAAVCTTPGGNLHNTVKCIIPGPVDDGTVVITYVAIPYKDFGISGPNDQPLGGFCKIYDDGDTDVGGVDCTHGSLDLTINPWDVDPLDAENGPGQDHTIVFSLPNNISCYSSFTPAPVDQLGTNPPGGFAATRTCLPADVDVANSGGATAALVGVPVVSDPNMGNPATVTVVINSPTAGSVDVTLDLAFQTTLTPPNPQNGENSYDLIDPVAHKTYGIVGAGSDGVIRHVDLPDKGTEDAADEDLSQEYQPYCTDVLANLPTDTPQPLGGTDTPAPATDTPVPTVNSVFGLNCGVLEGQDDIDDAVGSFHAACLLGSLLTYTDNDDDLTWHIDPIPPGSGPDAESVSTFGGPNDEPCVMWGSATTGTQSIYVVYNEGEADEFTFFYSYDPDLELIKEWNSIDETIIVAANGEIGDGDDTLFTNTFDFDDWVQRDCSEIPEVPDDSDPDTSNIGFCDNANLDGLIFQQEGTFIINSTTGTYIRADSVGFIDYVMGSHVDAGGAYTGPVDGAEQEYTITDGDGGEADCGSVRLEDPTTGNVIILVAGGPTSAVVLSSDKGVGFTIHPNDDGAVTTTVGNADCGPNAVVCVEIDTANQANQFSSVPTIDDYIHEEVCVEFIVGPPSAGKAPLLAWAGQRVVLEHWWGDPSTGECLVEPTGSRGGHDAFGVQYSKQNGKGGFTAQLVGSAHDIDQTNDDVIVHVNLDAWDDNNDDITDPNSNCTSRVIYESEDETEADISAYIVNDDNEVGDSTPQSQQVPFVIYFLKFEDVTLGIVPGDYTAGPDATGADLSDIENSSTDVESLDDANVSANVLARVRVRGWVETTNCPARPSGIGENGEFLPANRCIFPDDWAFKAGGGIQDADSCISTQPDPDPNGHPQCALNGNPDTNGIPEETFAKMDINKLPSRAYAQLTTNGCQTLGQGAEGPFSLLDGLVFAIENGIVSPSGLCGDSLAPYVAEDGNFPDGSGHTCRATFAPDDQTDDSVSGQGGDGLSYGCRETVFPDGVIDAWDAPMPPALIRFALTGVGYLAGADKTNVYAGNGNQFYDQNIPAEPWIAPCNLDGECYQWNSYGAAGGKDGPYHFWTDFASHGPVVISCAGAGGGFLGDENPCPDDDDPLGVSTCAPDFLDLETCGYKLTRVYSDNHGEAMTWINGDADLDFSECDESTPTENDHDIVLLNGIYCEEGDVVGEQGLTALAQYPDKAKHFAEGSEEVTITRTWGGIKEVTVCQDLNAANYCEEETPGVGSQFHYVVFHVTDRDGLCGAPDDNVHTQLHPVLFEEVQFHIDSQDGVIVPDVNGHEAEGPDADGNPAVVSGDNKEATTHTFDTAQYDAIDGPAPTDNNIVVEPVLAVGECQAWIHVSESLLNPVNVIVTAFDPEGTVTFDTTGINPTPTPTPVPTATPVPTPSPTPVTLNLVWGDWDCEGNVAPRDGQAVLKHFLDQDELSQSQPCPAMGERVMVNGTEQMWGDGDCNGAVAPRDGQAGLKHFLSQTELSQTDPCEDMGADIAVVRIDF